MIDVFDELIQFIVDLVREVFTFLFGEWNWQIIFSWLPSDFLTVATWFILFLFGIMLVKLVKNFIPF